MNSDAHKFDLAFADAKVVVTTRKIHREAPRRAVADVMDVVGTFRESETGCLGYTMTLTPE